MLDLAKSRYGKPAVMCSFGKDSLVLLHLCQNHGNDQWPILFYREPSARPNKYRHAMALVDDWNLRVYDYPPAGTSMTRGQNGHVDVVNHYLQGSVRCDLRVGIDPQSEDLITQGRAYHCAKDDFLNRPLGRMDFPWDCVLLGHRGDDTDILVGDVGLRTDIKQMPGGADWLFPIRTWTEQDIWDYIEGEGLPFQHTRYQHRKEIEEKTFNPDFHTACTRCMDPARPDIVFCPKLQKEITNISNTIRWVSMKHDYYGEKPTPTK